MVAHETKVGIRTSEKGLEDESKLLLCYERCLEERHRALAKKVLRNVTADASVDRSGQRELYKQQIKQTEKIRKKQYERERRVMLGLAKLVGRKQTVLDLFSGEMGSTLPLLMSGRIQQLHTLDAIEENFGASQQAAARLGLDQRIIHHSTLLDHRTQGPLLPDIKDVTMAGVGLELPQDLKHLLGPDVMAELTADRAWISHFHDSNHQFPGVLKLLGGCPRVLHIADAIKDGREITAADLARIRLKIENTFDQLGEQQNGWSVVKLEVFNKHRNILLAQLQYQ